MDRNDIIKIIPKPKNEDVIIYDTSLKNLIDIDVFEKYNSDFLAYKIKKENYVLLENEIKEYEEYLNKIYLYNKTWDEKDYLEILQKEKITYNNLFSDIKKIENNISIFEKKYQAINEQIEIQRNKDVKEIEEKRENIDKEITDSNQKILNTKTKISDLKLEYDRIKLEISDTNEEIELLNSFEKELENKEFTCPYCASVITNGNSKRSIKASIRKKIEKKNKILDSLYKNFEKIEQSLNNYNSQLSNLKAILKNNIEFKKQDYNFYIKKSIKILQLEATRQEIIKKINELKTQYQKNPKTKKENFKTIKDRISKYELSLENLKKIKENKENFKEKYIKLKNLKKELLDLYENIKLYKKFIEIYFKIYEQKINDYFGKNTKFKLFRFDNFELKEIFEIYYKDIEYTQLNKVLKKEFDDIYLEKISYFS